MTGCTGVTGTMREEKEGLKSLNEVFMHVYFGENSCRIKNNLSWDQLDMGLMSAVKYSTLKGAGGSRTGQ